MNGTISWQMKWPMVDEWYSMVENGGSIYHATIGSMVDEWWLYGR